MPVRMIICRMVTLARIDEDGTRLDRKPFDLSNAVLETVSAFSSTVERLFDRFYRADKARTYGTGFGIGISMAKAIVEKHKGSISAYRPGEGRIGFQVRLQLYSAYCLRQNQCAGKKTQDVHCHL